MLPERKYSFEGVVASLLFIALLIVVMIQIFGRTPLFAGPVWTEELARWLWVWMAFIAIAEVERTDRQLRMGFLSEMLPAKYQRGLFTLIDIAYLGIMIHLSWIGYKTVLRTWNNEAVTLPTSDAALYASAFVASFLIINRILRRIFGRTDLNKNVEPSL
ncbi:TRAP transporter small permease [Ahrensia sp. 13_GOM-1096m]|uniref:TRAP transporter small permease n=1 Tax=Ahrensia sp. 13_GOM-1096m TaxID=1380380 RepID=UPI00047EDE09|nr:TRAP transporter small permease [Ahrensia sp. 13_GOM-1096m]